MTHRNSASPALPVPDDPVSIPGLEYHFFRGTPFRNIFVGDLILVPLPGNIQIAIAASEFLDIGFPVHTGTDDVFVRVPFAGCQSARAYHVTVSLFIGEQRFEQLVDALTVVTKKIPLGFLDLFQHFV